MGKSNKNLESDLQHSVPICLMSNATLTPLTHVNRIISHTSAILSEPSPFHPEAQFSLPWKKINIVLLIASTSLSLVKWIPPLKVGMPVACFITSHMYSHRPGQKLIMYFGLQPRGHRNAWQNLISRIKPGNCRHITSVKSQFTQKEPEWKFLIDH